MIEKKKKEHLVQRRLKNIRNLQDRNYCDFCEAANKI